MSTPICSGIVGMDIGGANLKYANLQGVAYSRHFAMWRHPGTLAQAIMDDLSSQFADCDTLAVTMTGELADCFVDRGQGVEHIVRHVTQAADQMGIKNSQFYCVDGQFRSAAEVSEEVDLVAAANWHALASYVGGEIAGDAVLVDIGSTTTDIVPIVDRRVATAARTDYERMREGSLVYVGCRRTPACAVVNRLRFQGQESGVMNEMFATIDDARIVLGYQAEFPQDCDTADGKPRTRQMAANRLARMIGLDRRHVSLADAKELALQVHDAVKRRISHSLGRCDPGSLLVISGHGDDLLQLPESNVLRLAERLGPEIARCGPSYAVAQLLRINQSKSCH